jgi:hypothetical protein
MFGIMLNLVRANLKPKKTAVEGTVTMTLQNGETVVKTGKFFWIVVCQRSPYNGALCEGIPTLTLILSTNPNPLTLTKTLISEIS